MQYNSLNDFYFDWITLLVIKDANERDNYLYLLNRLNEINFYYTIPLDENRYIDGLSLRDRFAYENHIPDEDMYIFQDKPCSVLEMMIALALKCEENIMSDPDYGDRISNWFLEMISSLQLQDMTNANFDQKWVDFRIQILLDREYNPDGFGGLFTIPNCKVDLRTVEIWYQMCWYLNTIL